MKIIISEKINGRQNLINYIEKELGSPYQNDNWDGFIDCLWDLSWVPDTNVEIIHESLPVLSQSDMLIYLDALYEAEMSWRLTKEKKFSVVFPKNKIQEVDDVRRANNLALFKRMSGSKLYQIQFGYSDDNRLLKSYFQFDGFCFFIDGSLRLEYYPLSVYQLSDVIEGKLSVPNRDDDRIRLVKTLKNEVKDCFFYDCKRWTDKDGQNHFMVNFKKRSAFIKSVDCFLDSEQVFRCFIDKNEL